MNPLWPWITLALLGAYHGINPGMGWLFAVSLGLQERSRAAVLRAFAPIAIGHFVSIMAVVALVAIIKLTLRPEMLRYAGAAALITFGIYKMAAPMSHPRWVGMRVSSRQLALWSFLMATAHGAGLMVVPLVLQITSNSAVVTVAKTSAPVSVQSMSQAGPKAPSCPVCPEANVAAADAKGKQSAAPSRPETGPSCHTQIGRMAASGGSGMLSALGGVSLHTLAMFLAMAAVALVVYNRIGLKILRTAWYNLDLVWAAALVGAGVLTLLV